MKLTPRLSLAFLLFSMLLLGVIFALVAVIGREEMYATAFRELEPTAEEKTAAMAEWLKGKLQVLSALASEDGTRHGTETLIDSAPGSGEADAARAALVEHLAPWSADGGPFLDMFIIHPDSGQVLAATNPAEQGKFKENQPYFIEGKNEPTVEGPYFSVTLQGLAMTAAAPIYAEDGRLLGVLAGRLNLDELTSIVSRRSGLHQTDEAFLVNASRQFVTQPRLLEDTAVLRLTINTQQVKQCVNGASGQLVSPDYRGVPVVVVYHWIPERQLCLVVKLDEAEVIAPLYAFIRVLAAFSLAFLLVTTVLSASLARVITKPILLLRKEAAQIGAGNWSRRVEVHGRDEIAELAREFNEMADRLAEKDSQLRRQNEELEMRVRERTAELREKEYVLSEAQRIAHIGSWQYEIATNHVAWSDETYRIYGVSPENFVPTAESLLGLLHPEDRAAMGMWIADCLAGRKPAGIDIRIPLADGATRIVHGQGDLLVDDNNNPLRIIGTAQDITERKRAEEQIRRRVSELEALYYGGVALSQTLDPREIGARIIEVLTEHLDWHHAAVRVRRGEGQEVELLAAAHVDEIEDESRMRAAVTRIGQGMAGWVIEHGKSARASGLSGDPRYTETYPGMRSGLYVPIQVSDTTVGCISVESSQENAFSEEDERLLFTLAAQAAAALQNARLLAEARRRLQRTQALRRIDMAITESADLEHTLEIAISQIIAQLEVDAAVILLLDQGDGTLKHKISRGFRTKALQFTRLKPGEGYAGMAALGRRAIFIPDLQSRTTDFLRSPAFSQEGFVSYFGVPLIAKDEVVGVMEIFHRAPLDPDPEWLEFMETLAGQAAIAVDNAALYKNLKRSNEELTLAYDATIEGWSKAMDLRDKVTEGHTQRVTRLTMKLARAAGMSAEELNHVRRGALLHDIGKLGVPDSILFKPGKLTEDEWKIMRVHPQYAYEMLSPIEYLQPALDIPYCHHEKWDGTGYPRGLKGGEIPLAARLFAVVDVWDALTSDRPYRSAWSSQQAVEYLKEQSGRHFDPQAVDLFFQVMREEKSSAG
jgi:PAS domain S-box-containing protein